MESNPVDKQQVRAAFNRAAATYDAAAVLQREIGDRLLERLEFIRLQPDTVLDLGAGTGYMTHALLKRYRGAQVVALDIADAMLTAARRQSGWFRKPRFVCGDMEQLPIADKSVDLILSNVSLQWCNALDAVFAEFKRVLRPGGTVFFTTFGPDTLKELRHSWQQVDGHSHTNQFVDMHDIGDALLRAGLAEPVMDMEMLTLTYGDLRGLLTDIKDLGAHNVTAARARGLTGKRQWREFEQAYEAWRQDGRLPASYEVIYGHAWAPLHEQTRHDAGEVAIPVRELRRR